MTISWSLTVFCQNSSQYKFYAYDLFLKILTIISDNIFIGFNPHHFPLFIFLFPHLKKAKFIFNQHYFPPNSFLGQYSTQLKRTKSKCRCLRARMPVTACK